MDFKNYLHPFSNMDDMLHAIQIIKRLLNVKEKNFREIAQCINECLPNNTNITEEDIKIFIDKLISYESFYPQTFFENYENIDQEITNHR
jgi:hypothetical protein